MVQRGRLERCLIGDNYVRWVNNCQEIRAENNVPREADYPPMIFAEIPGTRGAVFSGGEGSESRVASLLDEELGNRNQPVLDGLLPENESSWTLVLSPAFWSMETDLHRSPTRPA